MGDFVVRITNQIKVRVADSLSCTIPASKLNRPLDRRKLGSFRVCVSVFVIHPFPSFDSVCAASADVPDTYTTLHAIYPQALLYALFVPSVCVCRTGHLNPRLCVPENGTHLVTGFVECV